MCGIIGRISKNKNNEKIVKALKKLEYRGYDSYGIFLKDLENKKFFVDKNIGCLDLDNFDFGFKSNIEIGHTRWATHGGVEQKNAHPHFSNCERFFCVMNGIIENFSEIRQEFSSYDWNSDCDSEIIPVLFSLFFDGNLVSTYKKVISKLSGEFSFVINFEDKLLVHKNSNPIIIGKNSDEFIISSDNNIIQELCDEFVVLDDDDFCLIDSELSFSYLNKVLKKTLKKNVNIKEIKTTTFMESEILEQKNLKNIFFDENLKNIYELVNKIKNCNKKIILSAAGTSFHACLFFHYKLLEYGILSQVILASEFENYLDIIDDDFLIIVFSQSGETGDLIRPLKILSQNCVEIVSVLNNRNSSIEYLSKSCVFLNCGEEISVASTKAFGFQIFIIEVISDLLKYNSLKKISKRINFISDNFEVEVDKIFKKVDEIIFNYDIDKVFFIGRNSLFPIALEGALKLKEVSYMHSEGFAGGELKHGSLALVDTKTLVFCLDNNSDILSNAIEIKTRGGIIIGLGTIQSTEFDDFIKTDDLIFMIIALQIIGLKYSLSLGLSPDKPRNLAKSVTVR